MGFNHAEGETPRIVYASRIPPRPIGGQRLGKPLFCAHQNCHNTSWGSSKINYSVCCARTATLQGGTKSRSNCQFGFPAAMNAFVRPSEHDGTKKQRLGGSKTLSGEAQPLKNRPPGAKSWPRGAPDKPRGA